MEMEGFDATRKTRVVVVDDQISVREMVAMVLERDGLFAVAAEAASGIDGLRLLREHRPELLIAALALPEMSGPGMIHAIRNELPETRVLIYSGSRNRALILEGLEAGPHGFVHKTEPLSTLQQAFVAVANGSSFFCPFATRLLDETRRKGASDGRLTPKERTVLQMVAEGMSTKQVAGRLSLSPKTVEHYRMQLMQKLGLRDVASLTRYAVRCGLVGVE